MIDIFVGHLFRKRSISPLIATILLVVVAVALIAILLSWGKGFTTDSLEETTKVYDDSDLTGYVWFKSNQGKNLFIENKHDSQDLTITGYKVNYSKGDIFNFSNKYHDLNNPINISSKDMKSIYLPYLPSRSFNLSLYTDNDTVVNIKVQLSDISKVRDLSYNLLFGYDMETKKGNVLYDVSKKDSYIKKIYDSPDLISNNWLPKGGGPTIDSENEFSVKWSGNGIIKEDFLEVGKKYVLILNISEPQKHTGTLHYFKILNKNGGDNLYLYSGSDLNKTVSFVFEAYDKHLYIERLSNGDVLDQFKIERFELYEISDNQYPGVLMNNPSVVEEGIRFDGVDDFIFTNLKALPPEHPYTFLAKIKVLDFTDTDTVIFSNGLLTNARYFFFESNRFSNAVYQYDYSDGRISKRTSNALEEGREYILASTFDNNSVNLYVNGSGVSTTSQGILSAQLVNNSYLGFLNRHGGSNYFNGIIYDIRFYDKALTEKQIKDYYRIFR